MSLGLNKTKRRMMSIRSTKKITKAMELIATVKLKKYKSVMMDGSLFSDAILSISQKIFRYGSKMTNVFTESVVAEKDLFIVVNSDLGLCASYNNNVFHLVNKTLKADDDLIVIGAKGISRYRSENLKINHSLVFSVNDINYKSIQLLVNFVLKEFRDKKYAHIKLIYTHYVNSMTFIPRIFTILPIQLNSQKEELSEYPPLFEPNIATIVKEIVPIYFYTIVNQKIMESLVSEQASRRTAMENANNNADDLLEKLTLEYNKIRQASITQEITEVVGAANTNS
ncbi:MAG: ATP synthase F1 subunit gamma [Bacilli bacterium]|jgi:F-type H+-transporting ATPase subunit gamma